MSRSLLCSLLSNLWTLKNFRDLSIHKLFSTRADLHRTVYTHRKVKFCNEYSVPKDKLEHFKNKSSEVLLKEEDVVVSNDFGCDEKFPITDDRVSHLLPAYNEDRIVRVYAKKPELVEAVSKAFENLQVRMYGEKTQVHDTPKKKRIRSN
nr:unnamed protein product [Digitaria exilis]